MATVINITENLKIKRQHDIPQQYVVVRTGFEKHLSRIVTETLREFADK